MALVDNLVSYWSLEEASGTRNDSHGTNHLTDNNTVASATGKVGSAADFEDANSESLSITDNASLSLTGDMTVAVWINAETISGATNDICGKFKAPSNQISWLLIVRGSTGTISGLVSGDGTSFTMVDSVTMPWPGTWYFVVFQHDATANQIKIKVNNGSWSTASHSTNIFDGTAQFRIGARDDPSNYWDGLIDECAIWSRCLSDAEVTDLYNSGSGRDYSYVSGGGGDTRGILIGGDLLNAPIIGGCLAI